MAAGRASGTAGSGTESEGGYLSAGGYGATMARGGPLGTQSDGWPEHQVSTHALRWVDAPAAAAAIWKALQLSGPRFGPIVRRETGEALEEILRGLLPAVLLSIGVVAATSVLGAAAGAAVGALAGGVGAAPGAVVGGQLGYDLGVAALSLLGLGFLIAAIGANLVELKVIAERAVKRAVNSVYVTGGRRDAELALAAEDFALAEATLIKLILMGLVALLLRRPTVAAVKSAAGSARAVSALTGAEAVAVAQANVADLVAALRASRLGEGFAGWVERNWRGLIENPRLRPQVGASSAEPAPSAALTPSQLAKARAAEAGEPAPVMSEYDQAKAANWKKPGGRTWWPPNDGAVGTPVKTTLPEGFKLDRYGGESGTYLSPQGASFESRALPGVPAGPANNYVVLKPLPVEEAKIAPWFDQPGGGTQYKLAAPEGWDSSVDGTFDVAAAKRLGYLAGQ